MSRTPGEYEVVFWNVRESFPISIIRMSSNTSAGFEQANQPFLTDIERRHLLNFCVVGMRLYLINWMRNLNSSPQVVVQRVSSFQLNYTTFSTQISPDIIQHSLNWQRLPSTTSHPISLELLINHWESISSLSYYRGFRSNQVWWRYTEKNLSDKEIRFSQVITRWTCRSGQFCFFLMQYPLPQKLCYTQMSDWDVN